MLDFESKLVHFEHTLNIFDKLIPLYKKPISKTGLVFQNPHHKHG